MLNHQPVLQYRFSITQHLNGSWRAGSYNYIVRCMRTIPPPEQGALAESPI